MGLQVLVYSGSRGPYGDQAQSPESKPAPAIPTGNRTPEVLQGSCPGIQSKPRQARQNLTMRMSMRRFTRLTNAFRKKIENHVATVALHCMYYNFVRIHQSLRVTPAMEAGESKATMFGQLENSFPF